MTDLDDPFLRSWLSLLRQLPHRDPISLFTAVPQLHPQLSARDQNSLLLWQLAEFHYECHEQKKYPAGRGVAPICKEPIIDDKS